MKKYITCIAYITFIALVAGCGQGAMRSPELPEYEPLQQALPQTQTTSTSETIVTGENVPRQPPPPPVVTREYGDPYSRFPVELKAHDNMCVQVYNTTAFFVCAISPTYGNGIPVFRLRYGNYAQDFLPVHPEWKEVQCNAVIVPNETGTDDGAPEAWFVAAHPGTYRMIFKMYTDDGNGPQYTGITKSSEAWAFPNVHALDRTCPSWFRLGCLRHYPVRASLEDKSAGGAYAYVLFQDGPGSVDVLSMFDPALSSALADGFLAMR